MRKTAEEGDAEAFRLFVRAWMDRAVRYCARFVGDVALANDMAQRSFVSIHQNRKRFHPGLNVTAWVYATLRHQCLHELRRRSRAPATVSEFEQLAATSEGSVLDELIRTESWRRLRAAMDQLPEAARDMVHLRYLDGLKLREIAEIHQCTVSAVDHAILTAIRTMSDFLK